jgi:hypothetical protein
MGYFIHPNIIISYVLPYSIFILGCYKIASIKADELHYFLINYNAILLIKIYSSKCMLYTTSETRQGRYKTREGSC